MFDRPISYDPLNHAHRQGQELIPKVRELIAEQDARTASQIWGIDLDHERPSSEAFFVFDFELDTERAHSALGVTGDHPRLTRVQPRNPNCCGSLPEAFARPGRSRHP